MDRSPSSALRRDRRGRVVVVAVDGMLGDRSWEDFPWPFPERLLGPRGGYFSEEAALGEALTGGYGVEDALTS